MMKNFNNKKMENKKNYNYNDVYKQTLEYFKGDELATNDWISKYCLKEVPNETKPGEHVGLDKILMICAKLISAEPFVKLKKAPKNASMAKAAMTISRQAVREMPNFSILSKVSA